MKKIQKIGAIILVLAMMCSAIPFSASAVDRSNFSLTDKTVEISGTAKTVEVALVADSAIPLNGASAHP